jgi:tRNA A37 methylthiotransferase MiaB
MNREYNPLDVSSFIKQIKAYNPDLFLRTDMLVGFPTETFDELKNSVDFVINHFSEIAVYEFELKDNTALAKMKLPEIALKERKEHYNYAVNAIAEAGLKVHSGGQRISTLIKNDKFKKE